MNRNDIKYVPHPVLVKRETIEIYKTHFLEMLLKSMEPGAGIQYMGMASEAEYVLEHLFEVPENEIQKLVNEALKNESKTNYRDMPDQEES